MSSIYGEFERLVKEKGKKVKILDSVKETFWEIENLIVEIDEHPVLEEDKIVAIIDISDPEFFYLIYISPLAFKNGFQKTFGIIDEGISSEEKLFKIFQKIQTGGQSNPGFLFYNSFSRARVC